MKTTNAAKLLAWVALGAALALVVAAALHGIHLGGSAPAPHAQTVQQLRQLAIPPIHPLPGATPAEMQTYLQAKAAYCADVPQAALCH